jgi:integrase
MRGRKPNLNWTESRRQFTATIAGKLHLLGTDEAKAKQQFDFLLRQASDDVQADSSITFLEVADYYLAHIRSVHSEGRYNQTKSQLEDFTDFVGRNCRAKDVRPNHVERWLEDRGYSSNTRRSYMAMVLACLNWAASPRSKKGGELIAANPLRGRLLLPANESRGAEAVWTEETFQTVLWESNPAFADLVRILAWTGCRPQVALTVEAKDYNKTFARWDVAKKVGRKTTPNIRLSGQAVELVERLNEQHPTGTIFRNAFGSPWTINTAGRYLRVDVRRRVPDLQEGLCLYGLRHTFATSFLAQNPNEIEYLRVLLGHKNYDMILAHYGHVAEMHSHIQKRMATFNPFK